MEKAKWYWLCPCGNKVNRYNPICPQCTKKKEEAEAYVKADDVEASGEQSAADVQCVATEKSGHE